MIDRNVFTKHWKSLCQRFNRQAVTDEAVEYRNYLDPIMDTKEFEKASRHLWATREFFPRPADFLLCMAQADFADVLGCNSPGTFRSLSDMAHETLRIFGGLDLVKSMYRDNAFQTRKEFLRCYETAAGDMASEYSTLGTGVSLAQLEAAEPAQLPAGYEGIEIVT